MIIKFKINCFSGFMGVFCILRFALPQASAANVNLTYVAAATAEDLGPQDDVFDDFTPLNFGSVNNNGYTSFRTAMEFDISSIPIGSTILAATLTIQIGYLDESRSLSLNGYLGNGTVQLSDFSQNGLVSDTLLAPDSSQVVFFDASGFIGGLVGSGATFAGFNLREDQANALNYAVFNIDMNGPTAPVLSIDFEPVPEPSVTCMLGTGLIVLIFFFTKPAKLRPSEAKLLI